MDQQSQAIVSLDRYGLADLIRDVWRRKWTTVGIMVAVALLGVVYGLTAPKQFKASVIVAPVLGKQSSQGMGSLGSVSTALGGLASLAGLSLPGKEEDSEAIAVLQSELITQGYIHENGLLPILYASEWNAKLKTWRTSDPTRIPTLWKANRYFSKRIRRVTEDSKTGLYVLSVEWKDPVLAARWANGLVGMTNDYLRAQAIQDADRNIEYLKGQAEQTTEVGVKAALYSLLENEIDKEMIARGQQEYALKVIDPAFVPEEPSSHGPILWGLLGALLGAVFAICLVFVRAVFDISSLDRGTATAEGEPADTAPHLDSTFRRGMTGESEGTIGLGSMKR